MKSLYVKSIGQILNNETVITDKTLVVSFYNTTDIDIIEVQKRTFVSNPSLLKFEKNILTIQKDDIQKISSLKYFIHKIKPYHYIFNLYDLKKIISFLKDNEYKNKDIIIQCEYGKSRSLTLAICLIESILKETHELIHDERKKRNKVIQNVFKDNIAKLI